MASGLGAMPVTKLVPSSTGLIQSASNAELIERDRLQAEAAELAARPAVLNLAAHIRKAFTEAETHRNSTGITGRLLDCLRRKNSEYDPTRLADIQKQGGNDAYINITETKTTALESIIDDVVMPTRDKPWSLAATPIPDLPESLQAQIVKATVEAFRAEATPDPSDVMQFALDMHDKLMKQAQEEAKERAENHEKVIADQLAEGGFPKALNEFVQYLTIYMTSIIKGPVIRTKRQLKWRNDALVVDTVNAPHWSSPSPHDFFPGPNNKGVDDGYICEIITFDPQDLSTMRGQPGWNTTEIDGALVDHERPEGTPKGLSISGNAERQTLENRDSDRSALAKGGLVGIEYWGSVKVSMLTEWGMTFDDEKDESLDPNAYKEITAILIGAHVVRAILNPDPLDRRPYAVTSFETHPGTVWGKAVCEKMAPAQDNVNAANRTLMDNLALASGPMLFVDIDALGDGQDALQIQPWMVVMYHGTLTDKRKPIEAYQPSANSAELTAIIDFYGKLADDLTLIPRFQTGDPNISGAGETFRGLSLLMEAAARGVRRVIGNIDVVIGAMIERIYAWNLMFNPDPSIKGDAVVVPRGVLATLVKQQTDIRLQQFLSNTANDIDMQIIGIEGRANMLRKIATNLDMDVDDIVPDKEVLRERQKALQAQQEDEFRQGIADQETPLVPA